MNFGATRMQFRTRNLEHAFISQKHIATVLTKEVEKGLPLLVV